MFISFSDDQLLTETKRLAACERSATAALLRSLVEVNSRRLYLREGCSSLFTYCTQVLHLSRGRGIQPHRGGPRGAPLPVSAHGTLGDGSLTLASARLLAPHFTLENHDQLIAAARHKSKRDVELLVATLAPKHPAATVLRRLPEKAEPAFAGTVSVSTLLPATQTANTGGVCGADSARPCSTGMTGETPRQPTSATAALPAGPGCARTVVGCTLPAPGHDDARDPRQASSSARPAGPCRALR